MHLDQGCLWSLWSSLYIYCVMCSICFLMRTKRKYFSSKVTPFAGNMGFALERCQDGDDHRVVMFHNEVLTPLPLCPGNCSWSQFKDAYRDLIKCPFNQICSSSPSARSSKNTGLLLLISLMTFINTYNAWYLTCCDVYELDDEKQ